MKKRRHVKLKCPYCNLRVRDDLLFEHTVEMHPNEKPLTAKKILNLKYRELARIKKAKALAKLPKIHCHICGKDIPRGKYKSHRIKEHDASDVILKKSIKKKQQHTQFSQTNLYMPYQGGSPGQGKKS